MHFCLDMVAFYLRCKLPLLLKRWEINAVELLAIFTTCIAWNSASFIIRLLNLIEDLLVFILVTR